MAKKEFKIFKPLLLKILFAVHLPLCLLFAGFSAIELRKEIHFQMERSIHQSETALKNIFTDYLKLFSESPNLPRQNSEEMRSQVEFVQNALRISKIDILDPIRQISLITGQGYKDSKDPVLRESFDGLPASMAAKRSGKIYHLTVSEKKLTRIRFIYGYIPFQHQKSREPFVLVAVFKSSVQEAIVHTLSSLAFMFFLTILAGLAIAGRLAYRLIKPIHLINQACREILAGKLELSVDVRTGDELELLAQNFNKMSQALLVIKRKAEDSNPLTQLPGNRQIMTEMNRLISAGLKFVYFHIDIDHFKAYNDRYGLGKGDEVLRWTGNLLQKIIQEAGSGYHFLGHQGGDDFVLITNHEQADKLSARFCKEFDSGMSLFYDEEILKAGFYLGPDERNNSLSEADTLKKHPLMSVSMAGVSNAIATTTSYDTVLKVAVRVKKKVKQIPYSAAVTEEIPAF